MYLANPTVLFVGFRALLTLAGIGRHEPHPASSVRASALFEQVQISLVRPDKHQDAALDRGLGYLALDRIYVDARVCGRAVIVRRSSTDQHDGVDQPDGFDRPPKALQGIEIAAINDGCPSGQAISQLIEHRRGIARPALVVLVDAHGVERCRVRCRRVVHCRQSHGQPPVL